MTPTCPPQARKIAYLMTSVSAIEVHKAQPESMGESLLLARKMVKASKRFRAELAAGGGSANNTVTEGGPMDLDEAFLVMLVSVSPSPLAGTVFTCRCYPYGPDTIPEQPVQLPRELLPDVNFL